MKKLEAVALHAKPCLASWTDVVHAMRVASSVAESVGAGLELVDGPVVVAERSEGTPSVVRQPVHVGLGESLLVVAFLVSASDEESLRSLLATQGGVNWVMFARSGWFDQKASRVARPLARLDTVARGEVAA